MSIGALPPGGLCGDVFVGRAHDDEVADIWQRVDFTIAEANPRSKWCDVARQPGGGGGGGSDGARSLSGLMNQNALTSGAHNTDEKKAIASDSFHEGKGDGYTWTQNEEEVELRFPVSTGTKAKYCKVSFGRTKLKVVVAGQTLLSGSLGGTCEVDESTFFLEIVNNSGSGRELCISLAKSEGNTWPFVIQSDLPTTTIN